MDNEIQSTQPIDLFPETNEMISKIDDNDDQKPITNDDTTFLKQNTSKNKIDLVETFNTQNDIELQNAHQKPPTVKRKQNMFANDSKTFIDYEILSSDVKLDGQHSDDITNELPSSSLHVTLPKTKTIDRSLSMVEFQYTVHDEDDDECIRHIDSVSLESVDTKESKFDSDQSLETVYSRNNSWESIASNILFDRSLSTFSELEYIKGRDDCRDGAAKIIQQIDSDNYHHDRRFSEDIETLEFIRGREDWLKNEMHLARSNTLPILFEHGSRKFLIQDEIDSDEYHHNFYLCEALRTATEIDQKFLTHEVLNKDFEIDISKKELLHRWKNENLSLNIHLGNEKPGNLTDNLNENASTSRDCSNDKDDDVEINKVLNNIIDANILPQDMLEKSPTDDIEIMILKLDESNERNTKEVCMNKNEIDNNPLIVISEATDDEDDEAKSEENERRLSNISEDEINIENKNRKSRSDSPEFLLIGNVNDGIVKDDEQELFETFEILEKPLSTEKISKNEIKSVTDNDNEVEREFTNIFKDDIRRESIINANQSNFQQIFENIIGKADDEKVIEQEFSNIFENENSSKSVTRKINEKAIENEKKNESSSSIAQVKFANKNKTAEVIRKENEQKITKQTKIQPKINDNFEDLIRDGSLGIWFHK